MDRDSLFYRQVALLVRVLPWVATEKCFALKGGTAINLVCARYAAIVGGYRSRLPAHRTARGIVAAHQRSAASACGLATAEGSGL